MRFDHNGFVKVLKGETFGMVITIFGLGEILRKKLMRQMAVYAFRKGMVRALLPRRILIIHDVAVGARARVR